MHPARAEPFGAGCVGTAGVPGLSGVRGAGPWLGADFVLELDDLPMASAALLLVGASRSALPPFTLPLDLGPIGMPGCSLRVGTEVVTPMRCADGRGRWTTRVPSDRAVLGALVYTQALVFDAGANRFGATMTNALAAVVGAK